MLDQRRARPGLGEPGRVPRCWRTAAFRTRERARLEELTPLLERGQVRPPIDEVLPLREVGKAHQRLDSGHGRGEVVLQVASE